MRVVVCVLLAIALSVGAPAASDDCQGVMSALASAQRDAQSAMEVVDALEGAIASPTWNPSTDGWMVDALGWAIEDAIGYLNAASIAEEQAHAAHCYLNQ